MKGRKPIPGFEGLYDISSEGEVRSLSVRNKQTNSPRIKVLKQSDVGGYRKVTLYKSGKRYQIWVHRLVLLSFVGGPSDGEECAHLDGNPCNNRLTNLKWAPKQENESHKESHGTRLRGERQHSSKLKASDIPKIFAMKRTRKSLQEIADAFGVSDTSILNVLQGKTWAHVKP